MNKMVTVKFELSDKITTEDLHEALCLWAYESPEGSSIKALMDKAGCVDPIADIIVTD